MLLSIYSCLLKRIPNYEVRYNFAVNHCLRQWCVGPNIQDERRSVNTCFGHDFYYVKIWLNVAVAEKEKATNKRGGSSHSDGP